MRRTLNQRQARIMLHKYRTHLSKGNWVRAAYYEFQLKHSYSAQELDMLITKSQFGYTVTFRNHTVMSTTLVAAFVELLK